MDYYRISIRGWTASFRYPTFISGYQPSLPVPPISTVYGLISAAKGEIITPEVADVGYVFKSKAKTVDLETIYELTDSLKAKSNVCRREILYEPELYIYVSRKELADAFLRPYYPLLLGRQTELVMVTEIKRINLVPKRGTVVGGTLLPFPMEGVSGIIQALPLYMTDTIPRQAVGVRPFYILDKFIEFSQKELLVDEEKGWGIWLWGENASGEEN